MDKFTSSFSFPMKVIQDPDIKVASAKTLPNGFWEPNNLKDIDHPAVTQVPM